MRINDQIAEVLQETAKFMQFKKENRFKIRAFEEVARTIGNMNENISDIAKRGEIENISSIGKGMARRIKEFLNKGDFSQHEKLKKEIPESVLELMDIPNLGPERVRVLYEELNVKDIRALKMALRNGKISGLEGFGEKTSKKIAEGLARKEKYSKRMLISDADEIAGEIISRLKEIKGIRSAETAGSLRRRKETIGDIDILYIAQRSGKKISEEFTAGMEEKDILSLGEDKISFMYKGKRQVDLRKIKKESRGAALQYFTGSKEHSVALRKHAKKLSLKVSEYGVFKGDRKIAGKTEKDLYEALNMDFIRPQLRENSGELDAALSGSLPELVEESDIRGDTHIHSLYSDGGNSVGEIAAAAHKAGYEWVGICDHSKRLKIASGLSEAKLEEKINEIKKINKEYPVEILCGQEVDILSDGSLDYTDEVLSRLDIVIAAIHSGFSEGKEKITSRIVKAMKNPYVNIIAHPTGRLLNEREAYEIDMDKIIREARRTGTVLEINAYPRRLDLFYNFARHAASKGVKMAIGTDAHRIKEMKYMRYGVDVAQRGWLEKKDLINTISLKGLKKFLSEKK